MEFRNTFEALQTNADEIANLISLLKKQEGPRRIDIDLVLEKLRSMYDLMLDIQTTVGRQDRLQTETNLKSALPEVQTESSLENKIVQPEPVIARQEEMFSKVPEEKREERKFEIDDIPDTNAESTYEKTQEEKLKERKQAARANIEQDLKKQKEGLNDINAKKTFVSDRFKSTKPTLAEDLASKNKYEDLSTQLKSQGATGISSSLGLNEKFEIINELFEGSKEKFEYTLQVLNMAGSFVEAYNYLKENFNWDMDNQHVQRLLEPIRRKLIVHRNDE